MPAGVGADPAFFGQHVAVEKEQDLAGCRPRASVPRPGQAEPAAVLAHYPDLQRSRPRSPDRGIRPVVDDHDLEQISRPGLAFERRGFSPESREQAGTPG